MKIVPLPSLLALSLLIAASCLADTPAFTTGTSNPATNPGAVGLVGFVFTLSQDIDLTQLGFYAQSIGGGDTPHVALLNITGGESNPPDVIYDTGNLNNLTNYPAGLTNDAMNYYSVGTPIPLYTGQTYEITAPIYFAGEFADASTFSLASAIQTASFDDIGLEQWNGWDPNNGSAGQAYDYTAQAPTANYTAPSSLSGTNVVVSASFQYTTVAVPEPGAVIGILSGAGMLAAVRRRR
jgi:hypothetical protein